MNLEGSSVPDIPYHWIPVEVAQGVPFTWGDPVSAYMVELHSKPGVYRWDIWDKKPLREIYIGESETVARRVRQYLKPKDKSSTDFYIHDRLQKSVLKGFHVRLDTLVLGPILLNTVRISNENLSDPFLRRMVENFAIVDTDTTQCKLLNHVANVFERRKRKAMKDNQLEALFQDHGLTD
jgi:hypothetical protein